MAEGEGREIVGIGGGEVGGLVTEEAPDGREAVGQGITGSGFQTRPSAEGTHTYDET